MSIEIKKNVDLAPLTTLKVGGRADFLVEANKQDDIKEALEFAQKNKLKIFVLAGGSNVLINDEGWRGLVIKMKLNKIFLKGEKIICEAGADLSKLVNFSIEQSLTGLEWAAGIPGSVGGAIRGNAGAFGGEMRDSLAKVVFFDLSKEKMELEEIAGEDCQFGYRESVFKKNINLIIVSAELVLNRGEAAKSRMMVRDFICKRASNQPIGFSAGSFFKNPTVTDLEIIEKFEHDQEKKIRGDRLPAGWFIQDL
ncbi:MAG: UDP-N-acetylmuramate dehydrogenase, partial [Candidatus Moraniibacteriota bacterium]